MKNSFKSFLYSVGLLALFLSPMAVHAAYSCVNGANGVSCPSSPTLYLMMPNTGNCVLESTVAGWESTCRSADPNKTVNCTQTVGLAPSATPPTLSCVCVSPKIDCSSYGDALCQTPVPTNATCDALNRNKKDSCPTAPCQDCKAGFVDPTNNVNNPCIKKVEVAKTSASPNLYNILNGTSLEGNVVTLQTGSTCTNNQTPVWSDNGTPAVPTDDKWVCGVASQWSDSANGIDYNAANVAGKNVGIGTAAQAAWKLAVTDSSFVYSDANTATIGLRSKDAGGTGTDTVAGGNFRLYATGGDDPLGDGKFLIYDKTALQTRLAIDKDGNVGIGTATPQANLDLYGLARFFSLSNETQFVLGNYAAGGIPYALFSTGGASTFGAGKFILYDFAAAKSRLTVDNAGKVGIGTETPANRLDVEGGAAIGATYSGTNAAPANGLIVEGNVGIGLNNPAYKLDVNGAGNFSGDITTSTNIKATGTIDSTGCFGPVLLGKSNSASDGQPGTGGYYQANSFCSSYGTGAHVCTTAEALNSINCSAISSKGMADGTPYWVSNGAPAMPEPTNDCSGWTNNTLYGTANFNGGIVTVKNRGVQWLFNGGTGGTFYAQPCNETVKFACCK